MPTLDLPQEPYVLFGNRMPSASVRQARRAVTRYAKKYNFDPTRAYPLVASPNPTLHAHIGIEDVTCGTSGSPLKHDNAVIVGNIRMGYGHYRMAMAIASAANSMGLTPYWFDLLSFDSPGAGFIKDLEYWYNLASRLANRYPLVNRLIWEPLTGASSSYRRLYKNIYIKEACRIMTDVYGQLPPELPFIGTHPWASTGAVHAGREGVVNIIPDNCALAFLLVGGALNTVQGPQAYFAYRTLHEMGRKGEVLKPMADADVALTGHYIDHELVANLEADTQLRLTRADRKESRRLLLSMGGAGAQFKTYTAVLRHLLPMTRDGRATLFLNLGDHANVWEKLQAAIPEIAGAATLHQEFGEITCFVESARLGAASGLHVFLQKDVFAAVYTTNLLLRVSDYLMTKPSELAYYPVPKIFTERVGGHEAWGAIRGAELGESTPELNSLPALLSTIDTLAADASYLRFYSDEIVKCKAAGIYNGAYRTVERAVEAKRQRVAKGA
jgi:hypothetical protein